MTAPDFTIADKLREARALVERGWTQGDYQRGDCVCALGALGMAFRGAPNSDCYWSQGELGAAVRLVASTVAPAPDPCAWDVSEWNDAPERTQAEVLAAFDRAIELASPSQ